MMKSLKLTVAEKIVHIIIPKSSRSILCSEHCLLEKCNTIYYTNSRLIIDFPLKYSFVNVGRKFKKKRDPLFFKFWETLYQEFSHE